MSDPDLAARLCALGIVVEDDFLELATLRGLKAAALERRARGEFREGRIGGAGAGAGAGATRRAEIRGDHTCWLAEPYRDAERALIERLDKLRIELNRHAFLGLFDLELHYAWYPPGAGYGRHVDLPQGRAQRVVTVILYLNEHWRSDAGGELRLFAVDSDSDSAAVRDIEPKAGRLVAFLAAGREHAVLAAREDRWSVSGWLRRRD